MMSAQLSMFFKSSFPCRCSSIWSKMSTSKKKLLYPWEKKSTSFSNKAFVSIHTCPCSSFCSNQNLDWIVPRDRSWSRVLNFTLSYSDLCFIFVSDVLSEGNYNKPAFSVLCAFSDPRLCTLVAWRTHSGLSTFCLIPVVSLPFPFCPPSTLEQDFGSRRGGCHRPFTTLWWKCRIGE